MCSQPITILNPTKYVSVDYKDRFLLQVPCGRCPECQRNISNEWLFRTLYEFQDAKFVYFDTLTYAPENLPYLSDIAPQFPFVPCFCSDDVTKFLKRLRISLERKFGESLCRYFLSSEYGSLHGRPHYHILIFCHSDKINPLDLSLCVSNCWSLGRTDGLPFRSAGYVLLHNVIKSKQTSDILQASNYVTKYVQKDCKLQSILDNRIKTCDMIIADDNIPFCKSNSVQASRLRQKIRSSVNQFHRQSLHYGESALSDMDLNQLVRDGFLLMPSNKSIRIPIRIPNYYSRKLFYRLVKVHEMPTWCLTSDGINFKKHRDNANLLLLASRFRSAAASFGLDIDCFALADYVLHYRGRYKAKVESNSVLERFDKVTHYPYLTRTDKETVGIGISEEFIGNSVLGYVPLTNYIKIRDFISKFVYLDDDKEQLLELIYKHMKPINESNNKYFSRVQELQSIYKNL